MCWFYTVDKGCITLLCIILSQTLCCCLLSSSRLHLQRHFYDLSDVYCRPGRIKCLPGAKPKFKSNPFAGYAAHCWCLLSGLSERCSGEEDQSKAVCENIAFKTLVLLGANILSFGGEHWQLWDHSKKIPAAGWTGENIMFWFPLQGFLIDRYMSNIQSAKVKNGARKEFNLNICPKSACVKTDCTVLFFLKLL